MMLWVEDLKREAETFREQLLLSVERRRTRSADASYAEALALTADEAELQTDRNIERRCESPLPQATLCPRCFYESGVISAMKEVRPIADLNSNSFSCATCGRANCC